MAKLTGMGERGERAAETATPLQFAVAAAELREFSGTQEGKHLERLEADQQLMLQLSVEGFGGKTWETVSTALVQYGWGVMSAWIASGTVFRKCRERGLRMAPSGDVQDAPTQDDALELAHDVVAEARRGIP